MTCSPHNAYLTTSLFSAPFRAHWDEKQLWLEGVAGQREVLCLSGWPRLALTYARRPKNDNAVDETVTAAVWSFLAMDARMKAALAEDPLPAVDEAVGELVKTIPGCVRSLVQGFEPPYDLIILRVMARQLFLVRLLRHFPVIFRLFFTLHRDESLKIAVRLGHDVDYSLPRLLLLMLQGCGLPCNAFMPSLLAKLEDAPEDAATILALKPFLSHPAVPTLFEPLTSVPLHFAAACVRYLPDMGCVTPALIADLVKASSDEWHEITRDLREIHALSDEIQADASGISYSSREDVRNHLKALRYEHYASLPLEMESNGMEEPPHFFPKQVPSGHEGCLVFELAAGSRDLHYITPWPYLGCFSYDPLTTEIRSFSALAEIAYYEAPDRHNALLDLPSYSHRTGLSTLGKAWPLFLNNVPNQARTFVRAHSRSFKHEFVLFRFLGYYRHLIDLVEENPCLWLALTEHRELVAPESRCCLNALPRTLRGRQRDLCDYLGLPSCEATARILKRADSQSWCKAGFMVLRRLLWRPVFLKFFCHRQTIDLNRLSELGRINLATITPRFLRELLDADEKHAESIMGGFTRLRQIEAMLPLGNAPVPVWSSLKSLERYLKSLTDRLKQGEGSVASPAFPPPPFAGDDGIVPITTPADLLIESIEQKNCAYDYLNAVRRGDLYLYRSLSPRVTLSIDKADTGHWTPGEMRLSCNRPVPGNQQMALLARLFGSHKPRRHASAGSKG